jgi:NDP-mannose synthase
MRAVILAGGKGTRLKPFTNIIPKPLVPIGESPILEIVLRQLSAAGIKEVTLAVNHMARLIEAFFGDGKDLGIEIKYSLEDTILGTAGPLRLVDTMGESIIAMNGDLLTTIDYRDFIAFHNDRRADITIATYKKDVRIDLGVLSVKDGAFCDYIEKPTYYFDVSMGIYCISPKAIGLIPAGRKFDMPDLVKAAHASGMVVNCYSGDYEWLDIGRIEDYETAISLFNADKGKYLPS